MLWAHPLPSRPRSQNFVTGGVHSLFNEKLTSAQATQVIGTQLLKELNRDAGLAGGAAEAQTPGGALVPATPATAPGLGAAPSQLYKWTAPTAGGKQKKGGALSHVLHRGCVPSFRLSPRARARVHAQRPHPRPVKQGHARPVEDAHAIT